MQIRLTKLASVVFRVWRKAATAARMILLCGMLLQNVARGQEVVDTASRFKLKPIDLTFQFHIGLKALDAATYRHYEGEYFDFDTNQIQDGVWVWRDEESRNKALQDSFKLRSYRITALVRIWKELRLGLDYHMLVLLNPVATTIDENITFFSIAGVVGYEYKIPKTRGAFIHPTFTIGNYLSNGFYEGKGREWLVEPKLNAGYRLKDKFGVELFLSSGFYFYRHRSTSEIFQRQQFEKINAHVFQIGLGLSYRFLIVPD